MSSDGEDVRGQIALPREIVEALANNDQDLDIEKLKEYYESKLSLMQASGKLSNKFRYTATTADKYELYQKAVQSVDVDIEFFDEIYQELRGGKAKIIKEDFCGTALISKAWVKSGKERTAVGVDLCQEAIDWSVKHNMTTADLRKRIKFICADVNSEEAREPVADMTVALNYSFFVFKTRKELKAYFEAALAGIKDKGLLIAEVFGGKDSMDVAIDDERDCGGFDYIWEQEKFNPITHDILCHINFVFRDGTEMKKAFTYDWRLWTIPEVRELMMEAGFSSTVVYMGEIDDDGFVPEYKKTEECGNCDSFLAYIVGLK